MKAQREKEKKEDGIGCKYEICPMKLPGRCWERRIHSFLLKLTSGGGLIWSKLRMKIVLQLFLITIITTRVDRKRGALLSCIWLLCWRKKTKVRLLLCVCVRGRVGSVGASR